MGLLPDSYPRGPKYNFCLALEPHPVKLIFKKIEHLYLHNSPWSCPVFPRPLFFLHAGSMPTTWGSPFKIWFNLKYWDIFVNILYSLSRYLWKVLELLEGISKPSLWHQAYSCTLLRLGNGDFFIQSKCQGSRSEIIKNSICHPLIVLTCFIYVIFVIEIAMLQLPSFSCCRLPLNYLICMFLTRVRTNSSNYSFFRIVGHRIVYSIQYSNLIFRKNEYYSFHKIRPNTESSILFSDQLFERMNSSNYSF